MLTRCSTLLLLTLLASGSRPAAGDAGAASGSPAQLLDQFCIGCHNTTDWAGGQAFEGLSSEDLVSGTNLEVWEKVLRMSAEGQMPPKGKARPAPATTAAFDRWLEGSLDAYGQAHPNPGRATLRRLNRAEYTNAVRDLLALDVDFSRELPADDSGYGFDDIADVLTVSPTLVDRYVAVAGKLSRLALGLAPARPTLTTYAVPKEGSIKNQGIPAYEERASDELPLDSRGGGVFAYYAPYDGFYDIAGYLNANTNNEVDRLKEDRVAQRVFLRAGPHQLGMAFRKTLGLDESVETLHNTTDVIVMPTQAPVRLPLDFIVDGARVAHTTVDSYHMTARFSQANFPRDVLQIDVQGPFEAHGAGDTPSRRRILTCHDAAPREAACARSILARLARLAYRRPVGTADLDSLMRLFTAERRTGSFPEAVAVAVQGILVSPDFLFLVERDPPGAAAGSVHPLGNFEFAARLALFLWSSLPDEELFKQAQAGTLREPQVLKAQVARMLADPRAAALTRDFAGQWLYLRNLEFQRPDVIEFPRFDTRLRNAMQRETEMFFAYIVRNNRSVMEFADADYTFLNQQLAEHYGIPGVRGTAFRKVALTAGAHRGGLLGQASILTVTSYGNHTSVVKRGKWILDNLLDAAPPPPPPDVPALKTSVDGRTLTAREQLQLHRANAVCASCHVKMDPLGFALEQYDAVGAYRTQDAGQPIDVSAQMPDGTAFSGIAGIKDVLRSHQEEFERALTRKLLTYALGRGLTAADQPTVRAIARATAQDEDRIQTLLVNIILSEPFNQRRTPDP